MTGKMQRYERTRCSQRCNCGSARAAKRKDPASTSTKMRSSAASSRGRHGLIGGANPASPSAAASTTMASKLARCQAQEDEPSERAGIGGEHGSLQDSTSASSDTGRSDGAKLYGLFQGPQRLARRHEFVGHIAREARIGDGAGDGVIIQLLGVVQLVASGHATGMEVPDMTRVLADRANHIPFHYLHVIDVV